MLVGPQRETKPQIQLSMLLCSVVRDIFAEGLDKLACNK